MKLIHNISSLMKRSRYWLAGVMLMGTISTHAQNTVVVSDPNFRQFLVDNFPTAMTPAQELDTLIAATFTGNFTCKHKNVSNADEIKYFKSIENIWLTGNNITYIPKLIGFTALRDFECDTNQLTTILCDFRLIPTLNRINLRSNQLTVIPPLNGMTALDNLFIDDNNLTALPDITGCSSLFRIVASNNQISSLPSNWSSLTNLSRLFLGKNNLNVFPDFSTAPWINALAVNNNNINSIPDISYFTNLQELDIEHNNLTSLPDLSMHTNLTKLIAYDNILTFEDLLPLLSLPGYNSPNFSLGAQRPFGNFGTVHLPQKSTFTFNLGVDASITTNTYKWYKDGVLIYTGTSNTFTITPLEFTDAGIYHVEITNSTPNAAMTIKSQPLALIVDPCITAVIPVSYTIDEISCEQGASLTMNISSVSGGTLPYSFRLVNLITHSETTYSSANLNGVYEGKYELHVLDNSGCTTLLNDNIEISRSENCDPVISPDGDGNGDSYYVSKTGVAKVYDHTGLLIKTMNTPAYWDGTDQNGVLMSAGYYLIVVDEKDKYYVTIMR